MSMNNAVVHGMRQELEWFDDLRPWQVDAVEQIISAYENGARFVLLDAPTGSGKTLIAETVRRMMRASRTLYLTHSLALQDQFIADYPYARLLKGRANYLTENGRATCADCTGPVGECLWCERKCPYLVARDRALNGELMVSNMSYLLSEVRSSRSGLSGWPTLTVVDEADVFEGVVMGQAEVAIGERVLGALGIDPPKRGVRWRTLFDWLVRVFIPRARDEIDRGFRGVVGEREMLARAKFLRRVRTALNNALLLVRTDGDIWVREYGDGLTLKPVYVGELIEDIVWRHLPGKVLLMTATSISFEELSDSLGLGDAKFVELPSVFDSSLRPVFLCNVAAPSSKNKTETWPLLVDAVARICGKHATEKIVIHSVSYEMTRVIVERLEREFHKVVSYDHAGMRDRAIAEFVDGARILVAPSVERGLDFPDDLCRIQIIPKVPYPYLGDRQVSTRLHLPGGQLWFDVQAARTLVQMCGRGMRHAQDWCITYVLDSGVKKLLSLCPAWWREAIQWEADTRWVRGQGGTG